MRAFHRLRTCVASQFLLSLLLAISTSRAHSATIQVIPPNEPTAIFGTASEIFVEGEIDENTPKEFELLINEKDIKEYSNVFLHSPGGNLLAGIAIGRIIRKHGFNTYVAKSQSKPTKQWGTEAGACFSACTLAYMGGVFRFMDEHSRYGVHRFYSDRTTANDKDIAQMMSAVEVQYLREMGIETSFFSSMVSTGRDSVYEPNRQELENAGVVNNGATKPIWTIEGGEPGLYLKGERQTAYGINKFMVFCEGHQLRLYVMFDPQGRQLEVMNSEAHSLVVDNASIPIKPLEKSIQGQWFNAIYVITPKLWTVIASAKTAGVIVQKNYSSSIFLGFDQLPLSDGRAKLKGMISQCQ